ncbi:hypothetical protein [Chryseobacterium sp. Marseille-Q8038]
MTNIPTETQSFPSPGGVAKIQRIFDGVVSPIFKPLHIVILTQEESHTVIRFFLRQNDNSKTTVFL